MQRNLKDLEDFLLYPIDIIDKGFHNPKKFDTNHDHNWKFDTNRNPTWLFGANSNPTSKFDANHRLDG